MMEGKEQQRVASKATTSLAERVQKHLAEEEGLFLSLHGVITCARNNRVHAFDGASADAESLCSTPHSLDPDEIFRNALDLDLRTIGLSKTDTCYKTSLPLGVASSGFGADVATPRLARLEAPLVAQLLSVSNVSLPSYQQRESKYRGGGGGGACNVMLRLVLTDGRSKFNAVEYHRRSDDGIGDGRGDNKAEATHHANDEERHGRDKKHSRTKEKIRQGGIHGSRPRDRRRNHVQKTTRTLSLSMNTVPGTKILLREGAVLRRGLVLLTTDSYTLLGGHVPFLEAAWKARCDAAELQQSVTQGPSPSSTATSSSSKRRVGKAPKFTPFVIASEQKPKGKDKKESTTSRSVRDSRPPPSERSEGRRKGKQDNYKEEGREQAKSKNRLMDMGGGRRRKGKRFQKNGRKRRGGEEAEKEEEGVGKNGRDDDKIAGPLGKETGGPGERSETRGREKQRASAKGREEVMTNPQKDGEKTRRKKRAGRLEGGRGGRRERGRGGRRSEKGGRSGRRRGERARGAPHATSGRGRGSYSHNHSHTSHSQFQTSNRQFQQPKPFSQQTISNYQSHPQQHLAQIPSPSYDETQHQYHTHYYQTQHQYHVQHPAYLGHGGSVTHETNHGQGISCAPSSLLVPSSVALSQQQPSRPASAHFTTNTKRGNERGKLGRQRNEGRGRGRGDGDSKGQKTEKKGGGVRRREGYGANEARTSLNESIRHELTTVEQRDGRESKGGRAGGKRGERGKARRGRGATRKGNGRGGGTQNRKAKPKKGENNRGDAMAVMFGL